MAHLRHTVPLAKFRKITAALIHVSIPFRSLRIDVFGWRAVSLNLVDGASGGVLCVDFYGSK
jgi:hypothetical protein